MKDFIKYTLATITGMVVVSVVMGLIGLVTIIGMVASNEAPVSVNDNSVMVINLSGTLEERVGNDVLGVITGNESSNLSLEDMLSSIKKAKENDKIKGIYIESGVFSPDAPASMKAIRDGLADFKSSGKWIIAYADQYTQGTYYICSVADKVLINPQGMLDWHGLAAQSIYLKDMMAKFGVKMQLSKVGKYKSAPEMFTADGMSEPNREQVTAYVNGIWKVMVKEVGESRKITDDKLNEYADRNMALVSADEYLKLKLVDGIVYADEVKKEIKKRLGIKDDEDISQLSLAEMSGVEGKEQKGEEIAVYYAFGDIVESAPGGISATSCIASEDVCRDLDELADDDDVKAVVLRVNSGGGSAYASEQIWHSVMNLKAKKPVVVSMGGYAASGGYYISCAANYIFAEPTTLTGSIGIFGMFPDFSGLLTEKLGVKFDEVKTNKHSAFGTQARPFNEEELAMLNEYIDRGYNLFRKRVADGRGMTVEAVEAVAQGRVWTGADALDQKLVDGMGGIGKAVEKAAQLAKLKEYKTVSYPEKPGILERLMDDISPKNNLDESMQEVLGEYYKPFALMKNISKHDAIQARMPYIITIK